MGIYDRDYYRDDEPRGFRVSGIETGLAMLIVVNVAVYLVDVLLASETTGLVRWLALPSNFIEHPWTAWQLVTYGFLHSTQSIRHILFNMLTLWFFGREVEAIYGRRVFIGLYLSLVVMSGVVWLVTRQITNPGTDTPVVGASGAVTGILMIFICHYPFRTIYLNFFIPIPAWLLGVLYIAHDVFGTWHRVDNVAYTAHLGGAAFGFLFFKTGWYLFRLLPSRISLPRLKAGPKLRVHDPDKYESELNEKADKILEKISVSGQDSLTADERRTLEEYSRRMQQKRR
jgi:membrane associated rhomboid family serine protease